jgi:serine protease Do
MRIHLLLSAAATLWTGVALADPVSRSIPAPPTAITKSLPESLDDLKLFQKHVHSVTDKVIPCTVCLRVGGASGSGVIVSKDGLILTAGHVSGEPGKKIKAILYDGRQVNAVTLGFDPVIDSGMVKITDEGEWPYTEIASSKNLKPGAWAICTGHPGGWVKDRPPVVRVGKIGNPNFVPPFPERPGGLFVQSDCALVGGDSGGPLFDMDGRVIGIHSRIGDHPGVGASIAQNMHVPSDRYKETWDSLVKGEILSASPYLGVGMEEGAKECKLGRVTENAAAAKAGLKAGDIITKFGGKPVASYDEMVKLLKEYKPLAEVTLEVKRGEEVKEFKVKIGWRSN